jgi:hypothetical protein
MPPTRHCRIRLARLESPERPTERVAAFCNQHGTAYEWIKEGKDAIKWTLLLCRTFAANAVPLQLHVLALS